jgi:hypothetical protein
MRGNSVALQAAQWFDPAAVEALFLSEIGNDSRQQCVELSGIRLREL